jgi:hypothetical protein
MRVAFLGLDEVDVELGLALEVPGRGELDVRGPGGAGGLDVADQLDQGVQGQRPQVEGPGLDRVDPRLELTGRPGWMRGFPGTDGRESS